MISIQTNVDSLVAQQNLNLDNEFQSSTIQQLTSGYRINKSGDDAAGLAIANGIESQITQLNQGVNNANDGVSQLQIVDGGLSNISTILNRLQTLATQSASSTFTGNRATLNQEYSGLLTEITRQATNINLNGGGSFNGALSVFIGGGSNSTDSAVNINLGGAANAVDATSLGLANSNVLGGGTSFANNTLALNTPGAVVLNNASASESFLFHLYANGSAQNVTATVTGALNGITTSNVLSQLNTQLNTYGITAALNDSGELEFSGSTPFNVTDEGSTASTTQVPTATTTPALISSSATLSANNSSAYIVQSQTAFTGIASGSTATDKLTFETGGETVSVTLNSTNADTLPNALEAINAETSQYGIYAVVNTAGTGIDFQSTSNFTVQDPSGLITAAGSTASTAPTTSATTNATSAITAITAAIKTLGLVQGVVGAAENTLGYAINLAQSQITNFSSAESNIKDADVAAQAANLSKAQVLTQTAVAALAQANSEPQAILKLLQ